MFLTVPSLRDRATGHLVMAAITPYDRAEMGHGSAFDVDTDFLRDDAHEGFTLNGVVPNPKKSQSGVTVGSGVDLGQMSKAEIMTAPISRATREKLVQYAGKKGLAAAEYLRANPLTVSHDEAERLTNWKIEEKVATTKRVYERYTGSPFADLPKDAKTALMSVVYHGYAPHRAPIFWAAIKDGRWADAVKELKDFRDDYDSRHEREAERLQRAIDNGLLPAREWPHPPGEGPARPKRERPKWKSRDWRLNEIRRVALAVTDPAFYDPAHGSPLDSGGEEELDVNSWDEWFPSGEDFRPLGDDLEDPALSIALWLNWLNASPTRGALQGINTFLRGRRGDDAYADLYNDWHHFKSESETLNAETAELRERLASLQHETTELRERLASQQRELAAAQTNLQATRSQLEASQSQLAAAQAELAGVAEWQRRAAAAAGFVSPPWPNYVPDQPGGSIPSKPA